MKQTSPSSGNEIFNSAPADDQIPTIAVPTPEDDSNFTNSGSDDSNSYDNTIPTPFPTLAPLPTIAPYVAPATTTSTSSSGNSNCTTGDGIPNSYYSDVYPNPTITTNTGSVDLIVEIRDCNGQYKNAPVSDKLSISLSSGDSNTLINGNKLPYSNITTQNGEAKFTVTSQVVGIVTLVIHDDTSNFTVTDRTDHNPSITFTNNSSGNSSVSSNCSTANGVANFWYSTFSPASPINANTGSTATITVNIQDCSQNNVSSDNLTFSQTSNDSSLTVNGSSAPVSVQAQNGVATFNVTSQNAGTDTFTIQDTTGNFPVTDIHNDKTSSIVFSGSSTATPTPTAAPVTNPTDTPLPTAAPSDTPITTP
jgi:hypothetical protein